MRTSWLILFVLMLGTPLSADQKELLNQEERQWLRDLARPLILGTETNYHPYNFVNDAGEFDGVAGDYVRLLERNLNVEFELRQYDTFTEVLNAARDREIDVIPALIAAPERKSYLEFTQPVFETQDRIFTRQDTPTGLTLDDLGGMKVSVVDSYALQAVLEADYPEIIVVPTPSEPEGLLAVSLGEVDAFISEIGTSSYYIQRDAITNLQVAGEIDIIDSQTFGTRSDLPILNRIIGKGLAAITPEEHAEIQRRWINISGVDPVELEALSNRITTVLAVGLAALFLVLIWTFSLRRLVANRTAQLETELAERRAVEADKVRLAVAVEQSAEFVVVIDTSARIEYANRAFIQQVGDSSVVGQAIDSLAIEASKEEIHKALETARTDGSWEGHVFLAATDDQRLKFRMNIAPIYDEGGEIDGYVATGRDVTAEEQIEAQLRQGERLSALGTLSGGIAHDFNNLLVPILGYAGIIRSKRIKELDRPLDRICEAGERARDLIHRIMVFGRGGTGEMQPLNLWAEIEDAVEFVKHLIPSTIAFSSELTECGSIVGDRTQIQQILLNLCSNASDAMAVRGGTLTVHLGPRHLLDDDVKDLPGLEPGTFALLTVTDTGVGMSEETKARIFDPYFTQKQLAKGTGLGMSIVHGAVTRHGGQIFVQSQLGQGTTFRIFFPTASAEAPLPRSGDAAPVVRGNGERILLVDDDTLVLSTLKNMLLGLGYEADAWSDPGGALRAFREAPDEYDAILTDLTMPGLTGDRLAQEAESIRSDVPVAIMTGNPAAANHDLARITKPVQLNTLSQLLEELVANSVVETE